MYLLALETIFEGATHRGRTGHALEHLLRKRRRLHGLDVLVYRLAGFRSQAIEILEFGEHVHVVDWGNLAC
jgi:hypothetical protein